MRFSYPLVLAAGILFVTSEFAISESEKRTAAWQLENDPLTIAASTVGAFGKGRSWYLSMNSAGQAELTIETYPERTRRQFQVSKEKLAALRKALRQEKFFDLSGEYGEQVPDSSTTTLTVTAGDHTKALKLHFLMNWAVSRDKARLREPARAVRVMLLIRNWFTDAEAVDLRKYHQMVLDAVKN
ncbi:MAG TPA: hypothetical protein VKI65_00940 [Gemmataceae bacterium]|nr:hypothetical protein [Gemmataceae bacterium]